MVDELIDEKRREFFGTSAVALYGALAIGAALAIPTSASAQSTTVKEPAVIGQGQTPTVSAVGNSQQWRGSTKMSWAQSCRNRFATKRSASAAPTNASASNLPRAASIGIPSCTGTGREPVDVGQDWERTDVGGEGPANGAPNSYPDPPALLGSKTFSSWKPSGMVTA